MNSNTLGTMKVYDQCRTMETTRFSLQRWRDEAELILSLPPKNVSLDIMVVTRLLTERQGNGLANFNAQYQYDPASCSARAK